MIQFNVLNIYHIHAEESRAERKKNRTKQQQKGGRTIREASLCEHGHFLIENAPKFLSQNQCHQQHHPVATNSSHLGLISRCGKN